MKWTAVIEKKGALWFIEIGVVKSLGRLIFFLLQGRLPLSVFRANFFSDQKAHVVEKVVMTIHLAEASILQNASFI